MKRLKLLVAILAFAGIVGCDVKYVPPEPAAPVVENEDPVGIPYNKTDIRGLREYCIKGVLYYGWLAASDGDWLAPSYSAETGQIQKCLVSDPQIQHPITRY